MQNGTTVDEDDNLLQSIFFQQSYQPTPQPGYGGFVQQLAACGSIPISDPIVGIEKTIHDQENSQTLDTDNSDDVLIPNIDIVKWCFNSYMYGWNTIFCIVDFIEKYQIPVLNEFSSLIKFQYYYMPVGYEVTCQVVLKLPASLNLTYMTI